VTGNHLRPIFQRLTAQFTKWKTYPNTSHQKNKTKSIVPQENFSSQQSQIARASLTIIMFRQSQVKFINLHQV